MNLECIGELCRSLLTKWLAKKPSFQISTPLWTILLILTMISLGRSVNSAPPPFARSLSSPLSIPSGPFDFGNQTIRLNHEVLPFTNGFYRSPDGQHVARLTDRRVNRSITKAAAILIDNPVGSGIFSYVIGATRTDGKERYSTPVFLGDRIKIEAVSVSEKMVTVYYLDHPANAPLGAPPTKRVAVIYTIQDDGSLHMDTVQTSLFLIPGKSVSVERANEAPMWLRRPL